MWWKSELLILFIALGGKKSRSWTVLSASLNPLVYSFLVGDQDIEEEPAVLPKILLLPLQSFPGTTARRWGLIGSASSQGQWNFLELSQILVTQLWNTPFLFTEHLKSNTEYTPKVLEFKESSHVKCFDFLFLKPDVAKRKVTFCVHCLCGLV